MCICVRVNAARLFFLQFLFFLHKENKEKWNAKEKRKEEGGWRREEGRIKESNYVYLCEVNYKENRGAMVERFLRNLKGGDGGGGGEWTSTDGGWKGKNAKDELRWGRN